LTPAFYVVSSEAEFEPALRSMRRDQVDALLVLASPMLNALRKPLVRMIAAQRLAATYEVRSFVEDGGLMSYGPSFAAMYRRSAAVVDRILKGALPADLPIEQWNTFELVINRRAAQELGLSLPQPLLLRADDVIT